MLEEAVLSEESLRSGRTISPALTPAAPLRPATPDALIAPSRTKRAQTSGFNSKVMALPHVRLLQSPRIPSISPFQNQPVRSPETASAAKARRLSPRLSEPVTSPDLAFRPPVAVKNPAPFA